MQKEWQIAKNVTLAADNNFWLNASLNIYRNNERPLWQNACGPAALSFGYCLLISLADK
jgi:hypothetical protein